MQNPDVLQILEQLQQDRGDVVNIIPGTSYNTIRVQPENLIELLKDLKQVYGFNYLANLTAVDYADRLEVVYHIHSIPDNRKLCVKTSVNRETAELPSAVDVWLTADWQERELFDLMGIKFVGHPNLVRILLPQDFSGHPLRKDFRREVEQ